MTRSEASSRTQQEQDEASGDTQASSLKSSVADIHGITQVPTTSSTEQSALFESTPYKSTADNGNAASAGPIGQSQLVGAQGQDLLQTCKTALECDRKAGRPSHPAWEHFVRGEKRNRFHHHAYCRYCVANGIESTPIRGVSGNMIRHLQKCPYCPDGIVAQLRNVCAQKDAEIFNKKHQSHSGNVGSLMQDTVHADLKKAKRDERHIERGSNDASPLPIADEFIPLQLNMLPPDGSDDYITQSENQRASPHSIPAKKAHIAVGRRRSVDHSTVGQHVLDAVVSGGLPRDWITKHDTIARIMDLKIDDESTLNAMDLHRYMKNDRIGNMLFVSLRSSPSRKSSQVQLSLFNGDDIHKVASLATEEDSPSIEELAFKIETCLLELHAHGIAIHSILANNVTAFAACRKAVNGTQLRGRIVVWLCIAHTLSVLIGIILTGCESYSRTMAQLLMMVQCLSETRTLNALRQACGDSSLRFILPSQERWYSFVECIDCVRQYEDVIKVIAANQEPLMNDSVCSTIECPDFWEIVVSLSELMSPIKETYSLLVKKPSFSSFSLSELLYQFGRMSQQYQSILQDWQENVNGAGRDVQHVQRVLELLEGFWGIYEQRLLVLAYNIDYRMPPNALDRRNTVLQWVAVCKSAREVYRQWMLKDDGGELVQDLVAVKQKVYPFDTETTCEFESVRAFYLLISDSNPAIHQLGSRLFSIHAHSSFGTCGCWDLAVGLSSQQTTAPIRSNSFVSSATNVIHSQGDHMGKDRKIGSCITHSQRAIQATKGQWPPNEHPSNPSVLNRPAVVVVHWQPPCQAYSSVWGEKRWACLAQVWKKHCEEEMRMVRATRLPSSNLCLNEVFREKLLSRAHQDLETSVVDV